MDYIYNRRNEAFILLNHAQSKVIEDQALTAEYGGSRALPYDYGCRVIGGLRRSANMLQNSADDPSVDDTVNEMRLLSGSLAKFMGHSLSPSEQNLLQPLNENNEITEKTG